MHPRPEHYLGRITTLREALSAYAPVPDVQKKLVFHFERQGDYAGHEDIIADGIELYQRFLTKSDDELERGRLPREEVEDSLTQLREKAVTS